MSKLTYLILVVTNVTFLQCSAEYLQTNILVGNTYTRRAEVYRVWFWCDSRNCQAYPINQTDMIWSSPITSGLTEVKPVYYQGTPAILASTDRGAIVYEYSSKKILFSRELTYGIGIHSAEVLPDGNVAVAGSMSLGRFGILYPGSREQDYFATTWNTDANFGHGVVYDKNTNTLYAAGYLTLLVLKYSNGGGRGQLTVVQKISLASYYEETNKNEPAELEDGAHDLYPIDGEPDKLYLTTGERVFKFNKKTYAIEKSSVFYQIPSSHSRYKVAVPNKGGVKAISTDASIGVVFAKSAPWYKEWYFPPNNDQNYYHGSPVVLWSMPSRGICTNPDYDLTPACKLVFNVPSISFYKARVLNFI